MNTLVHGQIGSGKTYLSIQKFIIPSLKKNIPVYTNIDFGWKFDFLAEAKFSEYLIKDLRGKINIVSDNEEFKKLLILNDLKGETLRIQKNSLVVIDEAQMIFNYLDVNRVDKRIYHFFSYARHFGVDFLFITQSPELLNKFILGLCNQFISVHNQKNVSYFLKKYYFAEISNSLNGLLLNKTVASYDKDIFSLYRSAFVPENDIVKRYLPAGFGKPLAMLLLFLFLIIFSLRGCKHNMLITPLPPPTPALVAGV